MNTRNLEAILFAAMSIFVSSDVGAACSAKDPSGFFEGRAESREAGPLAVSLNLRCASARYEGELVSPVGVFTVTDGVFADGRLRLVLGAGDASITIDAAFAKGSLRGTFAAGEDGGPLELRRIGDFRPRQATEPTLELTIEQWRKDVRHFIAELPKRHIDPFQFTPRAQWLAEAAELERNAGSMQPDQIYFALNRLANRIGDAHTYVEFPDDYARLPISVRRFGTDHRIVAAVAGYERALGARLVAIDDTPIDKIVTALRQVTPRGETDMLADSRIEGFLTTGMLLHGSGITPDRNSARLALLDDEGRSFTVDAKASDVSPTAEWKYVYAKRPLWLDKPNEQFRFVWLPESRMIYCSFRGYDDLRANGRALLQAVEKHRPEKLVIDMRRNSGGDYTVGLKHLVEPIRNTPSINRRNHLFVLIGPDTFSAAMSNAAHFRDRTAAILVGQTIGERPNSNQEPREFRLPSSRLVVRYSTRRYQFTRDPDNLIKPDQEVRPTWEAYKAGRDPVLEWVEQVRVE